MSVVVLSVFAVSEPRTDKDPACSRLVMLTVLAVRAPVTLMALPFVSVVAETAFAVSALVMESDPI